MTEWTYLARDEHATDLLGAALAHALPPSCVVCLTGTLGAGKTRLVRAVAVACAIDPFCVTSPTFTLCNEYHGDRTVYHLDLYRIRLAEELDELGLDEFFAASALTFVEWGERFPTALPSERIDITIRLLENETRQFVLHAHGQQMSHVLRVLQAELDQLE